VKRILRDLPFYENSQFFYLDPPSKYVQIRHRQIPVRVSLGVYLPNEGGYSPAITSFPAILDAGFNGSLALSVFHLREWAGLGPTALGIEVKHISKQGPMTIQGFAMRAFDSTFYIRPNRRGTWETDIGSPVEIAARILVVDAQPEKFRLPLLGMSALDQLGRHLSINYRRRLVQL